jgi:hypothetical protein
VRRLAVQQDFDLGVLPVEALLLVADVLDRCAMILGAATSAGMNRSAAINTNNSTAL